MADEPKVDYVKALKIGGKIRGLAGDKKALEKQVADLTAANTALSSDNAKLKEQLGNPSEDRKKRLELEGQIRTGKHLAEFRKLAVKAGVRDDAVGVLFDLSGYRAESDDFDAAALQAVVDKAKANPERAWAFAKGEAPAGDQQQQRKQIPGDDRGGVNNGGDTTIVTKADLADPRKALDPAFRKGVAQAAREHRLRIND